MIYRALAVLVCWCALVSVSAAELKIIGPSSVPVGGMALYRLEGVKLGDPFDFFVAPTLVSFPLLYDATGTPIGLLNHDKSAPVTLIAVSYDAESKRIDRVVLPVTIGLPIPPGPTPPGPTPPGPDPPTPVPPDVPEGKLGFTRLSFTEALKIPKPARDRATAIRDNFDTVASMIAAGALRTVEQANAEVTRRNRAVIPQGEQEAWLPWFRAWAAQADAALKAGTLKATTEDYQQIYLATVDGLRRIL